MHVVGSVIMLMHIDNDDTPKELDLMGSFLHLSGSLMKRSVSLPTICLFAVTHLTLAPQFLLFATFLAN